MEKKRKRRRVGRGKQKADRGREENVIINLSCDRVVTGLGIMECLTGENLSFKHQAKRLNQRFKIFKAQAKLLT